jgi:asparagine synthase (glutamine-hydrolysing)
VPFLDHRFVELAMSIPETVKTKNNSNKYILKKAVRGLIPDELIDRPKQGFGVPIHEWLAAGLGEHARKAVADFCSMTELLDRREVGYLLDDGRSPKTWCLLNLALWWREYIAG